MNLLITGGTGYLGGRIAKYFSAFKNINITIATRRNIYKQILGNNINIVNVNWESNNSIKNLSKKTDVIIHLASMNSKESVSNSKEAKKLSKDYTRLLLKYAVENNVKKIIYFSSAHVYSSNLIGTIKEETPVTNVHPYARNHLTSELIIEDYNNRNLIEGVILRVANAFGPPIDVNSNCWMLFANDICKQAIEDKTILLKSDAQLVRNFVTITNLCRVTDYLIKNNVDNYNNIIFNFGEDNSLSLLEFSTIVQNQVNKILGYKPKLIIKQNSQKKRHLNYKINKIKNIGFSLNDNFIYELNSLIKFCHLHFSK